MNQVEALRKIQGLGVPAFETRDISALLGVGPSNASVILSRLASRGFVSRLARGRWMLPGAGGRETAAEQLASPYPAYVSLQSALHRHGLIGQIPAMLYVVTLGRTRRLISPAGGISFHHLPPELFDGFEITADNVKLATMEKAFFDLLYLAPGRSRHFASLPEIDFPRAFKWRVLADWTARIVGKGRRTFVERKVSQYREQARRT